MSGKRSPSRPNSRQQTKPTNRERQNSQQSNRLSPPRSERVVRKTYNNNNNNGGTHQGQWLDPLLMPQQPHRSQSFRHRPRPNALLGDGTAQRRGMAALPTSAEVDSTPERRRSTPTIHRRASLCRNGGRVEPRIDVWPEPKQMSEAEERFLQLPDFADYTRVRQFNIDAKGAVIHRGDSFRRKRNAGGGQQPSNGHSNSNVSTAVEEQEQQQEAGDSSARTSVSSTSAAMAQSVATALRDSTQENGRQTNGAAAAEAVPAEQGSNTYKICVLGQAGAGKTSLIRQFISSSALMADSDDLNSAENSHATTAELAVSVNIGGHECELQFEECDLPDQQEQLQSGRGRFHAFLLVYSIDRKASFRTALRTLEQLRAEHCPAPLLLVGNKADLERRRTVGEGEVKSAVLTYDVPHFEVSVALNHDIDDLLVGIVAQVKESFRMGISDGQPANSSTARPVTARGSRDSEDFHAAIRRFSQRKKRQMGVVEMDVQRGKCMNLFEKLRKWRKGTNNC